MKACVALFIMLLTVSFASLADSKRITCTWLEQENAHKDGIVKTVSPESCLKNGANLGKAEDIDGRLSMANPPLCPAGFHEVNKQFDTVSFANNKRTFFVVARYCTSKPIEIALSVPQQAFD